ncbi:hypothetical protein GCM10018793_56120 [Streptomyces sulfonofaciens]|uniref:Uncharacterized protein n=1 Tax=Streptomyces sulfonofaciens TaxID=68272 RepID=A0A919L6R0_9ACTN|nr:hypothetical protein GCM10018793_56120 [Streptomyces sulfonofaciens]
MRPHPERKRSRRPFLRPGPGADSRRAVRRPRPGGQKAHHVRNQPPPHHLTPLKHPHHPNSAHTTLK